MRFRQSVLDPIFSAPHIEHVGHIACRRPVGISRRERELNAVIGQHGVDFVRDRLDKGYQEG